MRRDVLAFAFSAIFVWLAYSMGCQKGHKSPTASTDTVRVETIVYDTITENRPVFVSSNVIGSLLLPVTDTVHHRDSIYVPVMIEQKYYRNDNYEAWVSGYRPSLDSIRTYSSTRIITNTVTVGQKLPRFGLGVAVGPSVLLTPSGRVYGGIAVTGGVTLRF